MAQNSEILFTTLKLYNANRINLFAEHNFSHTVGKINMAVIQQNFNFAPHSKCLHEYSYCWCRGTGTHISLEIKTESALQ
jgi:hypothetical protein